MEQAHETEVVSDMAALLHRMVCALVNRTGDVSVETLLKDDRTILRLKVAPADVGKVIGNQGRNARSMRTILAAAGRRAGHIYTLDINTPKDIQPEERKRSPIPKEPHLGGSESDLREVSSMSVAPSGNPCVPD